MKRRVQSTLALFAVSAFSLAHAATLPYQGLATDAKGNPRSDGSASVSFALYSASTGGTALWSESQTLTTSKGLFSTTLGSVKVIPDSLFQGSALYLGVSFGGGSEGGRVLLGATPWASAAGTSSTSAFADSAGKVAGLSDSVSALRASLRDSMQGLRDTVTSLRSSLRSTIAGLNATLSGQKVAISSLVGLLPSSSNGIAWASVSYGILLDTRDGQVYRTVTIGTQTWMAQSLNYRIATGSSDTVGVCYLNSADNCAKYGRLYTWAQVMNGSTSSATSPSGVQGICPTGWHVPSDGEWQSLEVNLGMSVATAATSGWRGTTEGTKLKSTSGWNTNTGTDLYGFRVLPAGYVDGGSVGTIGYSAKLWSASGDDATYAWYRSFNYANANVYRGNLYKSYGFSLRCLKN